MRILAKAEIVRPVGKGYKAGVYALSDGRVVKLFLSRASSLSDATTEFEITRHAWAAGVRTWRVDEIVAYRDRYGIVGERIDGVTFETALRTGRISLARALRELLSLHIQLRRVPSPPPSLMAARSGGRAEAALASIAGDPSAFAGEGLCHGDLAPSNIMLDADGHAVVVDWSAAFVGPTVADVVVANGKWRRALGRKRQRLRHRIAAPVVAFAHRVLVARQMGWPPLKISLPLRPLS
ncbi:phosphotransferase family protein [Methylopila henanensis]|uniref:Phosphotransferase family protein n=1 Tax=Methylopila henanensis TaxID=873516 RepID=A0ABW4K8E9_9HYPH